MATVRYISRAQVEREIRIVELYRGNATLAGVARQVGVSVDRVRGVLRRAGVPIRPAAESRALAAERAMAADPTLCDRCGIKLGAAPRGRDGLCGWCIEELEQEEGHGGHGH